MDEHTLAWCKRLIGCRSVTGEGTRAIAELCARELLIPHGIEPRLIPSVREGAGQVNLVAMVKGRAADRAPLVFNTHLDTVPPGAAELWTECGGDPFAATVKAGRIYGLGAADTGGGRTRGYRGRDAGACRRGARRRPPAEAGGDGRAYRRSRPGPGGTVRSGGG